MILPVILGVFGVVLVYILGESAVKKLKSRKKDVAMGIDSDTDSERVVINLEKTDDVKEDLKFEEQKDLNPDDSVKVTEKKTKTKSTREQLKQEIVEDIVDVAVLESASTATEVVLGGVATSAAKGASKSVGSFWDSLDCDCSPDCDCS